MNHFMSKRNIFSLVLLLIITAISASAQSVAVANQTTNSFDPTLLNKVLLGITIGLLVAIIVLAMVVIASVKVNKTVKSFFVLAFIGLVTGAAHAQTVSQSSSSTPDMTEQLFSSYGITLLLFGFILLEFFVITILWRVFSHVSGWARYQKQKSSVPTVSLFERVNKTVAIEKEHELDLQHDYDGIRELDNRTPPWWKYAFIASIVFGAVYLWRYHIAEWAPLQDEEYQLSVKEAERERVAYLAASASSINEDNVKSMDSEAIKIGENIFSKSCSICHGKFGEGLVGPNLTDEYWINGGSLQSIFKVIKYGVPEKGMKSWNNDLSPLQIAQVSNFIKSIRGTNPPNPKDKQGELFIEEK